jgi:multiple sugar transport system substrate-binding protein
VKRKRTKSMMFGLSLVVLALSLVLAACGGGGGGAQEKNPESITVFLIPSPSQEAIEKTIPAFTKATGIDVNVVTAPYEAAHQKMLLSIRAKQGKYDVVQFDNPYLASFATQGALTPLDSYIEESKEYDIDDFVKPLQEYGMYEGSTYGLDLSTEPLIFWDRSDIYAKLGLKAPKTWAEYLTNAEKVQESGLASGQTMAFSSPQVSWWWIQLLWSFGGDVYNSKMEPTVDTPQAVEATEYMKKLIALSPQSSLSAEVDGNTSIFTTGQAGQMISFSGYYPSIENPSESKVAGKVGTGALPSEATDTIELTGWNIGIPSDSKKKEAAWKFLEYVLGKKNSVQFLEDGAAAIGRTSVTSNPELVAKYPYLKALIPAAENGRRLPALPQWPEVQDAIGTRVAEMLIGSTSVESGLQSMQSALGPILSGE